MKITFNSVEYVLSDWYQSSFSPPPLEVSRALLSKDGIESIFFSTIGLYIPLTSPDVCYKVGGEGSLWELGNIYCQIYKDPIYQPDEIEKAKEHIDNFLLRMPNLSAYL